MRRLAAVAALALALVCTWQAPAMASQTTDVTLQQVEWPQVTEVVTVSAGDLPGTGDVGGGCLLVGLGLGIVGDASASALRRLAE